MYAKTIITTVISDSSDFAGAGTYQVSGEYEVPQAIAVERVLGPLQFTAITAGTTLDMGIFPTRVTGFTIKNLDTTNFVTVGYDTTAATATTIKLLAGQQIHLVDLTAAANITLTADTASVTVSIFAHGA